MIDLRAWLASFQAAQLRRRKRAQRKSAHYQLLCLCVRLDEARRYVDRDRTAERAERDRLIRQRQAARDRLTELEQLLRQYLLGQAILDAERAQTAARRARDALASGFGDLGPSAGPPDPT